MPTPQLTRVANRKAAKVEPHICAHCGRRFGSANGRGLCAVCWKDGAIRVRYGTAPKPDAWKRKVLKGVRWVECGPHWLRCVACQKLRFAPSGMATGPCRGCGEGKL